jgi:hypothetical protein
MPFVAVGGTKSGEPSRVTAATKFSIACLAAPSFHEGSGLPVVTVCADAEMGRSAPGNAGSIAKAESNVRRLSPGKKVFGDIVGSFSRRAQNSANIVH